MSIRSCIVNSIKWFCNRAPEWIVAVTAIVAVLITLYQLQKTQQATTEQLKLTKSSIELAKRSAELSQRAWVLLADITFDELIADQPLPVTLKMKNVGASPAIDVRIFPFWWAVAKPVPERSLTIEPTDA